MYDLVIKGGMIIDGSGNPWYRGDVAIRDGRIVAIDRKGLGGGKRVIDARGLVVAPGFYDLHSHSDLTIMTHNRGESSLHQGVTTEGVGQCGIAVHSFAPAYKANIKGTLVSFAGEEATEIDVDWCTLEEWRQRLHARGIGLNIAPYCGHGTIRGSVMGVEGQGGERYEPTAQELQQMKDLARQAMEDGAFGLSTGLRYAPGRNAFTEEVIELARVAAEYGGIYISHMRSEEDTLIEAVQELIQICDVAGLRGCISHHKALFPENWGKPSETVRLVDRARARGLDIIIDFYPWTYAREANLGSWFVGHVLSPDITPEDARERAENLLQLMRDPATWEQIKRGAREAYEKDVEINEQRKRALGQRGVAVPLIWNPATFDTIVYSKTHPEFIGLNFQQVAKARGMADYWDAVRDVYLDDEGWTFVAAGPISEDDMITILKHPVSTISTDGSNMDVPPPLDKPWGGAHPRNYGSYPKVLQRYVREQKLLPLEEVIRKMTSLPAQFLGIKDRGLVREGLWADITVFDPERVENRATFAEPCLYPLGIPYVLVNGQVAIDQGEHTGVLAGRVLRRA